MSADAATVRADIREYIEVLNGRGDEFSDDDNIITKGVIASIQLLDLINHVAETYEVEVDESHLFDGHFASIDAMVAFIVATKAAAA